MSDTSNADRAEDFYDAISDGDMETVGEVMASDIEWIEAEGLPHGGTYHGFDEITENVFAASGEEWKEMNAELDRLVAEGDNAVGIGVYRGTHAITGKSFEAPFAHVMDFEDDQIVRFHQITDTVLHRQAMEE